MGDLKRNVILCMGLMVTSFLLNWMRVKNNCFKIQVKDYDIIFEIMLITAILDRKYSLIPETVFWNAQCFLVTKWSSSGIRMDW